MTSGAGPEEWFPENSDSEFRIELSFENCVDAGADFDMTEGGVCRRTEDTGDFDGVDLTWDVCMDADSMVEYTVAINTKDSNIPNEESLGSKAASEEVPDAQSCVDRADNHVGGMLQRKWDNATVITEDPGTLCIHTPERLVMLTLADPLFPQGEGGEHYLMLRVSTWVSGS